MKTYRIVSDEQLYEVTKDVAREIQHLTNQVRHQALNRNDCRASRSTYWRCEGGCAGCPFWKPQGESINDPNSNSYRFASSFSGSGYDHLSLLEWYQVIAEIIPDGERIAKLWADGYTDLAIARTVGVSTSTLHDRKMKLRKELSRLMAEW